MRALARDIARDVIDVLRAFARECRTPAGLALLGYCLLVSIDHTVLHSKWIVPVLEPFLPAAGKSTIRKAFLDVVFFGGGCALLIVAVHRKRLRDFGLGLPERKWVWLTAAVFAVQLVGIAIAVQIPAMREFYPQYKAARAGGMAFWGFEALALLAMAAWEFLNRGYLLFGLKERFGLSAVLVQLVPFVILHRGKPTVELYFSVFDGAALGLLAYASGSIWPAVFLHGVGAFVLDLVIVYLLPR
ncbi:MAG: type II CAAX prenyl endopeptidase Rce1 family protein [Myxococcota bacterium]